MNAQRPAQLDLLPAAVGPVCNRTPAAAAPRVARIYHAQQLNPTGRRKLEFRFQPAPSWVPEQVDALQRVAICYFDRVGSVQVIDQQVARAIYAALSEMPEQHVVWAIFAKSDSLRPDKRFSAAEKALFRGSILTFFQRNRLAEWRDKHPHYQRLAARERAAAAQPAPAPARHRPIATIFADQVASRRRQIAAAEAAAEGLSDADSGAGDNSGAGLCARPASPPRSPLESVERTRRQTAEAFDLLLRDAARSAAPRAAALARLTVAQRKQLASECDREFAEFVRGHNVQPSDARVDALRVQWRWLQACRDWPAIAEGVA